MRKWIFMMSAVLLFGVSAAWGDTPIMNAQDVPMATNSQSVALRGEIVSQQTKNQYLLTDGTGNVLVEISDDLLKGNRLAPGTEVEIEGRVAIRALRDPKVDAQSVTVLALHDIVPPGSMPGVEEPQAQG